MTRSLSTLRAAAAAALLLLPAAGALGVRRTEDPLALVPADAATVGVMHWNELRQTPLGAKVFADIDHMSGDDDAARFLQETGLTPREDIDTVIVAMSPGRKGGRPESGLVLFEGRFDLARIAAALTSRGAKLQSSPAGEYYRLSDSSGEPGAVALVNRMLLVCGNEAAVVAALGRRESGGEGGMTSGTGLGKHLGRVDRDASAWALVDLVRFPSARPGASEGEGNGEPARALVGRDEVGLADRPPGDGPGRERGLRRDRALGGRREPGAPRGCAEGRARDVAAGRVGQGAGARFGDPPVPRSTATPRASRSAGRSRPGSSSPCPRSTRPASRGRLRPASRRLRGEAAEPRGRLPRINLRFEAEGLSRRGGVA